MSEFKGSGAKDETIKKLTDVLSDYSLETVGAAAGQMDLTEVQAQAVFMAKGLADAELDTAVKTATLSAAQKEASSSALNVKSVFTGLGATLAAHPALIAALAAGALAAGVAYIAWYNSTEQVLKRQREHRAEMQKSIDSLNSESTSFTQQANALKQLLEQYNNATKYSDEWYESARKIADLSEDLVIGYSDEGEAILANTDKIREQIQEYRNLADEKYSSSIIASKEFIDTSVKDYEKNQKKKEKKDNKAQKLQTRLEKDKAYIRANPYAPDAQSYNDAITDLEGEIDAILEKSALYATEMDYIQENIKASYANLLPLLNENEFTDFEINLRTSLLDYASTAMIDSSQFTALYDKIKSSDVNKKLFDSLFTLQDSDNSYAEYSRQAQEIYEKLLTQLNITDESDQLALKLVLGIDDESLANAQYEVDALIEKYAGRRYNGSMLEYGDIEFANFANTLTDSELDIANSNEFASAIEQIKLETGEAKLSQEEYRTALDLASEAILNQKNATELLKTSISDSVSSLSDLQSQLNTLDSAVISYDENGTFSLDDLAAISDYFLSLEDFDTSAVDNALSVLSDSSSTTEQLAKAVTTVADQYLQASGILDTVTDRNKALIISQLESMGISNAQEIVNAKLAASYGTLVQAEAIATQHSINLSAVTYDEINSLLTEGQISEITARQLAYYAIQKQYCNGAVISTVADCQNMINLAKTAGYSTEVLSRLEALKARMSSADYIFSETVRNNVSNQINSILSEASANMANYNIEIPQATYNGGSNITNALNDASQAAQASAREIEDTYEELFDFFERRTDVLNDALDLLNTNLENVFGSFAKNQLIDAQIGINKESINNQTDALAMYQQKAAEALAKIPADLQSKITEGSVSLVNFIGSGNEDVVEAIKEYQNWADKVADCKQELSSLKKELRQLELDKFNNIVSDFTNRFDISSDAQDFIQKQIALFKEAGQLIGEGFYQGLIKESESQLTILEQERQALADELASGFDNGLIEKGSEEWLEIVDAFNKVDSSILDCKKDIEEFNNAIQDLHWDIIKRIQENFDNLSDEIKNLTGLIDDADVSDAEGNWSKEGLTQLGLYAQEYEKSVYAANMYAEEIAKLNEAFANGEYSATEYADKLADLKEAQWDEVNASEAAKDSIMSLNKERVETMVTAIEDEIDAMKELISSKKNALDAEEELYEYRKSISEKTKSVTDIERQIAAMQNDDTASTVAKRKKLEEQLAQAKEELADYEYSHSIDTQKSALDQQFEEFETDKEAEIERLRETLSEREAVIALSFETVKANAQLIGSEIALVAQAHGITVSESITTAWTSGENAVASYGEALGIGASTFLTNMSNMAQSVYGLQSQADATALSLSSMYNQNSENLQNSLITSWYSAANLNTVAQALDDSLANALGRGYDVSSLVNGMNSIGDAAANAANKVRDLMAAINGNGKTTPEDTNYGIAINGHSVVKDLTKEAAYKLKATQYKHDYYYIYSYAKGGLVTKDDSNPLNYIAKSVGEDTLIAAKDGELVLTPAEAEAFLKLAPNMESFNRFIPRITPDSFVNNIPLIENTPPSVQIHYDNLVQVQGDVNNSNIREMKTIVNDAITKQFNKFNSDLYKAGVR